MATVKYLTLNVAIISRKGSSRNTGNQKANANATAPARQHSAAVAAAAYRSGQKLYDEQARQPCDYSPREKDNAPVMDARQAAAYRSGSVLEADGRRPIDFTRKENVVYSTILAPEGAPVWVHDRQTLWNKVERAEKRKDAQLARDVIAALPRELTREQQIALVHEYVRENFTSKGMVADVNIHEKDASDGGKNPHVHIMLTTRRLDGDGFHRLKARDWNGDWKGAGKNGGKMLDEVWRPSYERLCNRYLQEAGSDTRVSMKSFTKEGIEKEPQKHLGYEAANLEKKGIESRRGHDNRRIQHRNEVRELIEERLEWQKSLAREMEPDAGWEPKEQRLEWQDGDAAIVALAAETRKPPQIKPPPSQPPSPSPAELHRQGLRHYLKAGMMLPAVAAAETIIRLDDMLIKGFEQARDVGWDVFDQVMGWDEPERRAELLRDEEAEREREWER